MKKIRNVLSMFVIAAILLAQTGCALITTRKVAMAVGKAVGKKVIEKKIEDNQAKKASPGNDQVAAQKPHEDTGR